MKYLIPLIFLFFACTEEVIKYVDKPVYLTQTVSKTDTLITTKEVVKDSVVYVPVYEAGDTVHHYDTVYVTVFVEVVDTVYVERTSKFEYDPIFEPHVQSLFERAENYALQRITIDVKMIVDNEMGPLSSGQIINGGYLIRIRTYECYEASVYRELLHAMYGFSYWHGPGNFMNHGWHYCFEDMNETAKDYQWETAVMDHGPQ